MELKARICPAIVHCDARDEPRRPLNLPVGARGSVRSPIHVVVRNLSISGLLIETDEKLTIGDVIELELPVAGSRLASVVWTRSNLFGCKFSEPVSQGSVSAALLQSPIEAIDWLGLDSDSGEVPEITPEVDEDPKALRIDVKFWIIVSLAIASWGLVGGFAMLLVHLLSLLEVTR